MVWAGISLGYTTDLHIFKRGSVTAVRYRDEVLEPIVRLYAEAVGPTFVLMDDNVRPHGADIVDDYLESVGIACRAWPAYSPDFNPIENLWDALGRVVYLRFSPPATLIELETALQEEWRLLNYAVVDHLIESMIRSYPKRKRDGANHTRGRDSVEDDELAGCPRKAITHQNISKIRDMIKCCSKETHFTSVEEVEAKTENLLKGLSKASRSGTVTSNDRTECRSV
ncbi:transposable element Tcb1 transposase [Trichonephila clavipes]|nr:transposable element Tcb1 transposase [Trichonephila clavipes]